MGYLWYSEKFTMSPLRQSYQHHTAPLSPRSSMESVLHSELLLPQKLAQVTTFFAIIFHWLLTTVEGFRQIITTDTEYVEINPTFLKKSVKK